MGTLNTIDLTLYYELIKEPFYIFFIIIRVFISYSNYNFFNFICAIYLRKRLKYRARAICTIFNCKIINRLEGKVEGCEFLRGIDFDVSDSQRTRSRGCRPFVIDRGTAIGIVTFSGEIVNQVRATGSAHCGRVINQMRTTAAYCRLLAEIGGREKERENGGEGI